MRTPQHRLVFPFLKEIRLNKWEICNTCEVCGVWFVCRHRDTKYCNDKCWRKSSKQVEYRRTHKQKKSPESKARSLLYWKSPAGRVSFRRVASKADLRSTLKKMAVEFDLKLSISRLYKLLVKSVYNNKERANQLLKGGHPDCRQAFVEFKIGVDYLRGNQLIFDILNGRKGRVRWLPSWDSLELTLEKKGKDQSILFSSYLSYLKWCEKPE